MIEAENLTKKFDDFTAVDSLSLSVPAGQVLAQLPPQDSLVITLLDLEEKSVKEVSELTGWSESLVKVRAFRARRKLRKLAEAFKEESEYE
jgi:DNA-directed RNA polymerase specialized sigma24 family protein